MNAFWQWQDDALWQSCSTQARARADAFLAQRDSLQQKLIALAATQPFISPDASIAAHAGALQALSKQLVVIGTGGASLGAQTLCALADDPSRVRFLENCDPVTLQAFLRLPLEQTSWVIVSKSGETIETLATARLIAEHYAAHGVAFSPRVRVITSEAPSTLSRMADAEGWARLVHPAHLGGRFSVFSVVGLFPACFAGMDIAAMLASAGETFTQLLAQPDERLLAHAAWFAANAQEKPMQVQMAYSDRLRAATQWYKQLWAESLGKHGTGPTPVTAIGAIDQHSQLQLYLDGPRDKLVTLWLPQYEACGPVLKQAVAGAEYLTGRSMVDVMHATSEATAATLVKAGVPLRIARGALSPQSLAAWMARQMLETLAVAILLGVDPFSQPAVEEGKQLTRAALKEMA